MKIQFLVGTLLAGASAQFGQVGSTSLPSAAGLLGNVGYTTVSGTVATGVQQAYTLPSGEDIYGPFEAGQHHLVMC